MHTPPKVNTGSLHSCHTCTLEEAIAADILTARQAMFYRLYSYFEANKLAHRDIQTGVAAYSLKLLLENKAPEEFCSETVAHATIEHEVIHTNYIFCTRCNSLHYSLPVAVSQQVVPACNNCQELGTLGTYYTTSDWHYYNPCNALVHPSF